MFFNLEEIKSLKSVEGKLLKKVLYHQWQNTVKPDYIIRFVEFVEFVFEDNSSLVLGGTEDGEGLRLEKESIKSINDGLIEKFDGDIQIITQDMSDNYIWVTSIGQVIKEIGIMSDDGSHFSNEAILIEVGVLEFEILPAEEGIEIKSFEDWEEEEEYDNL